MPKIHKEPVESSINKLKLSIQSVFIINALSQSTKELLYGVRSNKRMPSLVLTIGYDQIPITPPKNLV